MQRVSEDVPLPSQSYSGCLAAANVVNVGILSSKWSGARDFNLGPQGPEP
jgi:hypothetical protein